MLRSTLRTSRRMGRSLLRVPSVAQQAASFSTRPTVCASLSAARKPVAVQKRNYAAAPGVVCTPPHVSPVHLRRCRAAPAQVLTVRVSRIQMILSSRETPQTTSTRCTLRGRMTPPASTSRGRSTSGTWRATLLRPRPSRHPPLSCLLPPVVFLQSSLAQTWAETPTSPST